MNPVKQPPPNLQNILTIAYEPRWAIGKKPPTLDEIKSAHDVIKEYLVKTCGITKANSRVIYGGGVDPNNASEILAIPNVDGVLVGGCSLKPDQFAQIVNAA